MQIKQKYQQKHDLTVRECVSSTHTGFEFLIHSVWIHSKTKVKNISLFFSVAMGLTVI